MLSQRGRYALKALLFLARRDPEQLGVSAIAEAEQIPRKYLEAIMTELRKAQIVESARGWNGGYRLSRPAT
jgi:Rrf2 family protein